MSIKVFQGVAEKGAGRLMKVQVEKNFNLGLSLGMALAVVISWSMYNSVLWAILHGVLNWFYVLYYVFTN